MTKKCQYPKCEEPADYKTFSGLWLCEKHHDLYQFVKDLFQIRMKFQIVEKEIKD